MVDDTPTNMKKPNHKTDPWLVRTIGQINTNVALNSQSLDTITKQTGETTAWTKEHDIRHRKIDGRMALVAIGTPAILGLVFWIVQEFLGG